MPHALRTRFKKEIVAEFLPPASLLRPRARRTSRRTGKTTRPQKQRVIIICDGMPGLPSKSALMQFLSKKGFWVFRPRYRGTWESDGVFLHKSPEQDILDVIDGLPCGFTSLWDGKRYRVQPDEVMLIASSFGGPAGMLASRDPRVSKVVAISPVVDWQAPSKAEPLPWLGQFVREAFGNGYRFTPREWKKLASGTFYNPARHSDEISGSKLLIFHARDDESVRWNEVAKFARTTGATLKLFKRGGHLSSRNIVEKHWPQIAKFLR